jgi:hypothetical protein
VGANLGVMVFNDWEGINEAGREGEKESDERRAGAGIAAWRQREIRESDTREVDDSEGEGRGRERERGERNTRIFERESFVQRRDGERAAGGTGGRRCWRWRARVRAAAGAGTFLQPQAGVPLLLHGHTSVSPLHSSLLLCPLPLHR